MVWRLEAESGEAEVEKAIEQDESGDEEGEQPKQEEEEELTELENIQRKVFTGENPEFLRMTGPNSFVDRAKEIGVYKSKMKREKRPLTAPL